MMTAAEKLAYAVDYARYCRYDENNGVIITWNGSLTFNILCVETGDCIGMWTAGNDLGLTEKRFADYGFRLDAAIHDIEKKLSPRFAKENDGATYLELFGC